MFKFINFIKFGWLLSFLSTFGFSFLPSIEFDFTGLTIFFIMLCLVVPYVYYFVQTGIWSHKDDRYLLKPLAIIGFVLHLLTMLFMLVGGIFLSISQGDNSPPMLFLLPFWFVGVFISFYDAVKFRAAWKYKKFHQNNVIDANTGFFSPSANHSSPLNTLNNSIAITTQISFKEYRKLMLLLMVKSGWFVYIFLIGLVMLIGIIIGMANQQFSFSSISDVFRLIFGVFVVFLFPFSIYFSIKRNFETNKRISETIVYEFTAEEVKMTGQSFVSLFKWRQTHKIEELKNWFLIYETRQIANLVPKKDMSEGDINSIRHIIRQINDPDVKVKLLIG